MLIILENVLTSDEFTSVRRADVVKLARVVQDSAPQSDEARLANKIHANLLRVWAE